MKRADLGSRAPNPRPRREVVTPEEYAQELADRLGVPVTVVSDVLVSTTPGRCRVCGCTENTPCSLGAGFLCWWVDADHTLCSAPACLAVVPIDELDAAAGIRHTAA